jgi:hypothetical protein
VYSLTGILKRQAAKSVPRNTAKYAVAEIRAYIAIRDSLLAEAEELRTRAKLDSALVANDYVETCLKSARAPYQAQFFPKAEATRERQRCTAVKERIAELRRLAPDPCPNPLRFA